MLSKTFLLDIEVALTSGIFIYQDFNINTANTSNYVQINITYSYMPEYLFKGYIPKVGGSYNADLTPGEVIKTERLSDMDKESFFEAIYSWLNNISNELNASPYARKIAEHEEQLKEFRSKIESLEGLDDYFSGEERDDFEIRLDELEKNFSEKLQSAIEDQDKLKDELYKLHQDVDTLKLQMNALTKKNWYLFMSTRLYTWFSSNPIFMRQLAGFTRELLPSAARDVISNEALDQLLLPPKIDKAKDKATK